MFDQSIHGHYTRLVQIGNSRGIRLPKPIIEEARLKDEVDIHVREGSIVITSMKKARSGWDTSARKLRDERHDVLIDPVVPTDFDESEWKW